MDKELVKKVKRIAQTYFNELNETDFSHSFSHVQRVTNLALNIGKKEGADMEILEIASLLHDIGRKNQDNGLVSDHAEEGAKIARGILEKLNYPNIKIDRVCHCILTHRWQINGKPKTIEAKILQDADRLDALGAVDVARVLASSFQSKQYRRPVYIDEPYQNKTDSDKSAVHYLIAKITEPKRKPINFNTKTGRKIAEERYKFSTDYIDRFIKEWHGEI